MRRAGVTLVVAPACALVFFQSTYVDFERVRVDVPGRRAPSAADRIDVELPEVARLGGAAVVLLIDLRNHAPAPRTLAAALDGQRVGEVTVPAGRDGRLATTVPDAVTLARGTVLTIAGDGGDWSLQRAQLSNVRGFSSGLLNFVVVPKSARGYERPSAMLGWVLVAALVAIGVWPAARGGPRAWRSALGPLGYGALATIGGATLAAPWLAWYFTPYRILLALHTLLAALALIYLPAIEHVAAPILRPAALAVHRTLHAARAALPGRHADAPSLATRDLAATYLVFLALVAATSVPRLVGDGDEYMAMALSFADLRWPPATLSDHFWLYPALAAPLAAVTNLLRLGPAPGFLLVNTALLVAAFKVVAARVTTAAVVMLFAGPIIWWVDKVHAEVFLFSLLAMAVAWLREKPWWSLWALGVASAQQPAVAAVIPLVALVLIVMRATAATDRRFWFALAGSAALASLYPLYFLMHIGRAIPLLDPGRPAWPSPARFFAVLTDANIGFLANFPMLAIAMALAAWCLRRRRPRLTADQVVAGAASFVFLFAFAQPWNANHGGTRDMSRYALWLVPLTIPFFRTEVWAAHTRARRSLHVVAAVSAVWCVVLFHPGLGERYLRPTRLAHALWTRLPGATNPLPEIFVERLQGHEGPWTLPIATEHCEKALLRGRGERAGIWPPQCRDVPVPDACLRLDVLCYANRTGERYVFKEVAW